MAGLTAEQFRKLLPNANNEPITKALATGLNAIRGVLDPYKIPESVPLLGGQSAADLTGLTGAHGVVQDFSRGNLQSGDMRMFDLLGLGAGVAPAARTAVKGGGLLGKEALRQMNEGTGLLSKLVPDPRQYAVTKTDYEKAFDLAQKRAALPIEKGGLGLPATNTAMDRAKAMGHTEPLYRGTTSEETHFIPSNMHEHGIEGISTAPNPDYASFHGDMVMPLLGKRGAEKDFFEIIDDFENLTGKDFSDSSEKEFTNFAKNQNVDISILNDPFGGIDYRYLNPANLRSRFAAFDPFRRNESDVLAAMVAAPIGLLGIQKEKPKKKRGKKD